MSEGFKAIGFQSGTGAYGAEPMSNQKLAIMGSD